MKPDKQLYSKCGELKKHSYEYFIFLSLRSDISCFNPGLQPILKSHKKLAVQCIHML